MSVPEGDTIHYAARRIRAALVGSAIEEIETPQPRHALDRWPERLGGRGVRAVDAHGKHLFIRFEGDLTLHSHLRMTGKWGVYRRGERWRRSPRRAWLVMRTREHEVVQFDGPVLELMTDSRTRFDQRLAGLGPDILAAGVRRATLPAAPARGRPDAAASATPCSTSATSRASATSGSPRAASWPRSTRGGALRDVTDEEALAIVRAVLRPLMQRGRAERAAASASGDVGLRAHRPALPPLRHARSARAARATTTAPPTGVPACQA